MLKSWEIKLDLSQDVDSKKMYKEWKIQRKNYIRPIGQYLLTLSETDLVKWYDTIDETIHDRIKSDQHLLALLHISLLHYFSRSVERIRKHIPYIEQLFESKNRITIMCATKVVVYIAIDSHECMEFLRKICDNTCKLIVTQATQFAAIYILKSCGKYILPNVFEETSNFIDIIQSCLVSDDIELQLIAAKTLKYHFKYQITLDSQDEVLKSEQFFKECIQNINPINTNMFGTMTILKYMLQLYHDPKQAILILQKVNLFPFIKEEKLSYKWFDLLLTLVKDKSLLIVITPVSGPEIIKSLFNSCKKFHTVKIWRYTNDFLRNLVPSVINPYMCQCYLHDLLKETKNPAIASKIYDALTILLDKYELKISSQFFLNYEPSISYLNVLSRNPVLVSELKKTLLNYFHIGIQERATVEQTKVSISILNLYGRNLFENLNAVYDDIQKLVNSQNSEIRTLVSSILPFFTDKRALEDCQYLALFDNNPNVRKSAVDQLINFPGAEFCEMIPQVLTDPSYEVKRSAIKVISQLAPKNPMIYYVPITSFVQQNMLSMTTTPDPTVSHDISTLLPHIAKHLLPFCPAFIPQIMKVCYKFLNRRRNKTTKSAKLISVLQRDMSQYGSEILTELEPFDQFSTNLNLVYNIHNKDIIDERDANLFDTLLCLSDRIKPFILDLIAIYKDIFTSQRNDRVYAAALLSLIDIVNKFDDSAYITQKEPEFATILINLLKQKPSENVAMLILKLLSSFGITDYPQDNSQVETNEFDFKSKSYYTDSVMTSLLKLLREKQKCVFQAVNSIFVHDPDNAVNYLDPVIDSFYIMIQTLKTKEKSEYFKYLEVISHHCGIKIKNYAEQISQMIKDNIDCDEALRVGCVLSSNLKTEFTPYVNPLYHLCLARFNKKCQITKDLTDFLSFCVVFQNQPISFLITSCETILQTNISSDVCNLIVDKLTMIVQLTDTTFETTRIARICELLLKKGCNAMELLYSLVVFSDLSFDYLKFIVPEEDIGFLALKDYLECNSLSDKKNCPSKNSFLSIKTATFNVEKPSFVPQKEQKSQKNYVFDTFQLNNGNNEKWLDDLCRAVITESPIPVINACYETATQFNEFKLEIFPIAFLSCWVKSSQIHKEKFSNLMSSIFKSKHPDQIFLNLAETLIRASYGFNVSELDLANASTSPLQSLRFLSKYYQENTNDKKALEMLLGIFTKLGRIDSCRGILKNVELPNAGNWSLTLGEWDKALEIFEKSDKNLPERLMCYSRLERWEDIYKLNDEFQDMNETERSNTALFFAWAALKQNDYNNISLFMNYLEEEKSLDVFLFTIFYYTQTGMFEYARNKIEEAMKYLVSDCTVYNSMNANQAKTNLMYSCLFTELGEVIDYKEGKVNNISQRWERRLNNISGDSYSWMRLAEIRSMIINPTNNTRTYLKLISVLAKDRKWHLLDNFQSIVYQLLDNPSVICSYVKILWLRGKTSEAIDVVKLYNDIFRAKNDEEIANSYNNTPDYVRAKMAQIYQIEQSEKGFIQLNQILKKPTDKEKARMLRMEASYRASDVFHDNIDIAIKLFIESSKLNADDYRTWSRWAYACTKSIENDKEGLYVKMAVDGFLKASFLSKENSLEYICQLFSLYFRYGNNFKEFHSKIQNLNPQTIEKIIPQIVCQISHPDPTVRSVVHNILTNFSRLYFQALVFPLQLIAKDDENSQKTEIAKNLLEKLSEKHSKLAEEANLFASTLSKCAVTYYDIFLQKLDEAHSYEINCEREKAIEVIKSLSQYQNPKIQLYQMQFNQLKSNLQSCLQAANSNNKSDERNDQMWVQIKRFHDEIRLKLKSFDTIQIEKVSEQLAAKRNFLLTVPGTYQTTDSGTTINYIEPILTVLGTQQHPAITNFVGNDSLRWKFLLKGNEDLRLDQRIMQFFVLINSLIPSNKLTQKMNISILNYTITPLATNAGLISWVMGADTMHQLINDHRKSTKVHQVSVENEILINNVGDCMQTMNSLQRIEWWPVVTNQCPATDLRDIFWMKSQNPVNWIKTVDTFVLSIALMSLAGYVVGLGDRHPSNIMIRRNSGHVVHIDLGDSFEVTQKRTKLPEKVPFRLTRMIVNALGVSKTEGNFRKACENIMYMLRYNKPSIFAQLEIFVHEPIFASRAVQGDGNSIMKRVSMKLNGLDPELVPGEPVTEELSVEEQTRRLIAIAADPMRYVTHYDGWCPYW
ncbi:PIKK family atypical protein kinase [Trichomonas vaginalis G3]|uniref:non-specific serine/threonine protein kinase n=1 Tax=Trichomonas vaginalis (strain ATCC PRA-98 / G3) TaxID=412133 RepID=A2E6E9_TRIV3|nr:ataxia telangiectasia mutated (ATM) -related family [Trichomonas vaginalis G3]EAY11762.1 PIKK family atypical protein kinase [Trichomonas vaginalis G3]KAI5540633.1 ataxia telangiectasia mutated (ATM) -related family [Trichomonas vaginalis G3]|eukprot:XP_001323985.1 PIKK family atypical protein kinase [Trichomonas vaginalis G3]